MFANHHLPRHLDVTLVKRILPRNMMETAKNESCHDIGMNTNHSSAFVSNEFGEDPVAASFDELVAQVSDRIEQNVT